MLGLKRRKMQEGWAMDVETVEPDGSDGSLRQRLGDNNKLWVFALIAVILIVVLTYLFANKNEPDQSKFISPTASGALNYKDKDHQKFEEEFLALVSKSEKDSLEQSVFEAQFLGAQKFKIVVRGDVSADDIEYMSNTAANRILHRFHTRATIQAYRRPPAGGDDYLVATTRWRPKKFGFFVKFENRDTTP